VPQDPGASDELAKQGKLAFDYGMFWFKGQHIGSGQAPVKRYNRQLRDLIAAGKAEPSFIVSHELPSTGPGGLRALRQAGRRLDEGRPAPGDGGGGWLTWLQS
jgi:threonine dehydrogenase-like Zn-dependent dehydrogenase